MTALSSPGQVQARLDEIEQDLATRQNELEVAALSHFRAKREKEKARAEELLRAEGTVAVRTAKAEVATAHIGVEDEARWEGLKAVVRVLDTRAAIGMSLLRSHGRAGG
jgi:hypothetical protein